MQVLSVKNLCKNFTQGFWPFQKREIRSVVRNISFGLEKGEVLGFLGQNGAGKTTTIQMLLGMLTPSSGVISYFGKDFHQYRFDCMKKIGYASGYDKLPARLTVSENLDIIGRIYGIPQPLRALKIEKLLHFFGIIDLSRQQTGKLSAGQMTRVMLAKAFINDPEIVLLDEPTASLDPDISLEVRQFILSQCKERQVSVLITSHNMDEVTELCDRVLVLKEGSIIADSTPEQLAQSTSRVRVHLIISYGLDRALSFIERSQLVHTVEQHQFVVEIDEADIAQFLSALGEQRVIYSHISIDKPTLEDYFLSISRSKRGSL